MAFFPNFLRMSYKLEQQARTRRPFPEDQVPKCSDLIKHYFNSDLPHLFLSTYDPEPLDEIAIDASYKIAVSPEVRKILSWAKKKTLSAVLTENWLSKDVYIRITASMLNKLVESNIISKNISIYYHDNLVANVAALYYEVSTEELPF